MNPYALHTPREIALALAARLRSLRLDSGLKQATLAERSGVSLGSLRRFERTGRVSLQNLLRLSAVLGRLGDFETLFEPPPARTLDELEAQASERRPKRGTR